jgi:hypothetical protein
VDFRRRKFFLPQQTENAREGDDGSKQQNEDNSRERLQRSEFDIYSAAGELISKLRVQKQLE